jgi:hypothetical protein
MQSQANSSSSNNNNKPIFFFFFPARAGFRMRKIYGRCAQVRKMKGATKICFPSCALSVVMLCPKSLSLSSLVTLLHR